jgi:GDPmannose 4,6-dehydratase
MINTALVTGITGQDGAYLAKLLLEEGYKVCGAVRDTVHPNLQNLEFLHIEDRVELISTNLLDLSNVIRLLEKIQPQEIYNLASQSSVGLSFQLPIGTVEFNVLSTINLLEAMRIVPCKAKFYQASSSEMYGRVKTLPVTEETTIHPVSPYAISKAAAHWTAVNYREAYGLFSCCGILFNHESVLRGQHFVTKKVVSTAARISKGAKESLTLGNINIQRDWGYAPAYVQVMWKMLQQEQPDDYIIATGEAHSLKEFVELVFKHLGLNWQDHVTLDKDLYRPSDIEIMSGDPTKARTKLGWQYKLSFEDLTGLLVEEELRFADVAVSPTW